jgi:hypothetical protein
VRILQFLADLGQQSTYKINALSGNATELVHGLCTTKAKRLTCADFAEFFVTHCDQMDAGCSTRRDVLRARRLQG